MVQRGKKFRTWKVAGWISGAEFAQRYGVGAYWWFKIRTLALPYLIVILAAIFLNQAYRADEQALHNGAAPARGSRAQRSRLPHHRIKCTSASSATMADDWAGVMAALRIAASEATWVASTLTSVRRTETVPPPVCAISE